MRLLVYTPLLTPRVEYAFRLLFESALAVEYQLITDSAAYCHAPGPRLNYSGQPVAEGEIWLPAGPLLRERGIRTIEPDVFRADGMPAFFRQPGPGAALPFDLPALAFFLASRYEEYLPFQPDALGRFPASESLAHKHGFLCLPLANQWALRLGALLEQRFPGLHIRKPAYRFRPTIDVDMAWAYRHRPLWRILLASLRGLLGGQWAAARQRLAVLAGRREDPFFTFSYLSRLHQEHQLAPAFFFLLGDYGKYDTGIRHTVPAFRALIRAVAQEAEVGIHPSFRSNHSPGQLEKEVRRLEAITGSPVRNSRQHFLMIRFPQTYDRLLQAGIRHDYTMGFADATGFRAGLATPFPWYNLEKEKTEPLTIHPFAAMDVSLRQYLSMEPAQALSHLRSLSDAVRAVGGEFCTLWHNSSFSEHHDWRGWGEVYEKIVSYAR